MLQPQRNQRITGLLVACPFCHTGARRTLLSPGSTVTTVYCLRTPLEKPWWLITAVRPAVLTPATALATSQCLRGQAALPSEVVQLWTRSHADSRGVRSLSYPVVKPTLPLLTSRHQTPGKKTPMARWIKSLLSNGESLNLDP